MIEARELDLPDEFRLPESRSMRKDYTVTREKQGEIEMNTGKFDVKQARGEEEDTIDDTFEELEKKFDDISNMITDEMSEKEESVDTGERNPDVEDTGLIEEWNEDEERLIDED
jgi:hypothetical protein